MKPYYCNHYRRIVVYCKKCEANCPTELRKWKLDANRLAKALEISQNYMGQIADEAADKALALHAKVRGKSGDAWKLAGRERMEGQV